MNTTQNNNNYKAIDIDKKRNRNNKLFIIS